MKIIVSSKHLADKLRNVEVEYISSVIVKKDRILIFANDKEIEIQTKNYTINDIEMDTPLEQTYCRWDFLYSVVSKIDETPILLTVSIGILKLELTF